MLESLATILVCGIATYLATYYSNKQARIADVSKRRIIRVVLQIITVLLALVILYCAGVFICGIMGLAGIHAWGFSLYDDNNYIIYHYGMQFEGKLEKVWFIIQGMVGLVACILLLVNVHRTKKKN